MVNLKRPTLRLSPLEDSQSEDTNADHADSQHHHGLEFEYDCDAPKCGIYVHVVLSPSHHLAEKSKDQTRLLVFETVTDGGFGKMLKLEEGAMLELGRFEHRPHSPSSKEAVTSGPVTEEPTSTETTDATATASEQQGSRHRKRFTNFHFRRRNHDRAAAGPALAVVDAQPADSDKQTTEDDQDNLGVKVTINLKALDEEGKELKSVNEQTTYLHVVRYGAPPIAPVPLPGQADQGPVEEDKRPWVVKVVKREATVSFLSLVADGHELIVPANRSVHIPSIFTKFTACQLIAQRLPIPSHLPPHLLLRLTPTHPRPLRQPPLPSSLPT